MVAWKRGGKCFNLLFIGFREGLEEERQGASCPVGWTYTANSVGKFSYAFWWMQLVVAPEAVAISRRVRLMAGTAHCCHSGDLPESGEVLRRRANPASRS